MTAQHYRRLTKKGDPRTGFMIPQELLDDLKRSAQNNGRQLAQEMIARLATTLEDRDMMSHDRLMRLIFCKKLAWKDKD